MTKDTKNKLPGVFLLPNLITTSALFSGFFSIISSINGEYTISALAILIAMVLDGLDGRIARLTNTQTSFGEYYDSLSDMICFGVAPALLIYIWNESSYNSYLWQSSKITWIICFIYVASAAIRLARFSSKIQTQDKKYFVGLASPASAAIIICFVWMVEVSNATNNHYTWLSFLILPFLSFLMISNITYYSFKDINIRHKVPHLTLFVIALILSFISFDPPLVLFSFFLLYALSGPSMYLMRLIKKKNSISHEKNTTKS